MIRRVALSLAVLAGVGRVALGADGPSVGGGKAHAEAAAEPAVTLKVGDAAPALAVSKWVKGDAVSGFEKGKIYVIECWATWCGPCRAAMPHVTQLQAKYKDKGVVVIGMDVWERDLSLVEPFVKEQGDKMGYAVAMDVVKDPKEPGVMATTWLKAAGRNGIPCSFIVDREGKIAWIGHPMMMERVLSLIANDKFDPAGEKVFDEKMAGLQKEFSAAMKAKDYDKAIVTQDQMLALDPFSAPMVEMTKLGLYAQKGDFAAVNTLAAKLAAGEGKDEPMTQFRIAMTLLNVSDVEKVDAKLALDLALKVQSTEKDNAQLLALVAKAYAANKQFDKAVEYQTKAIAAFPEQMPEQMKALQTKVLEDYKAKAGK